MEWEEIGQENVVTDLIDGQSFAPTQKATPKQAMQLQATPIQATP